MHETKHAKGCKIGLIPCENASTLNVFFFIWQSQQIGKKTRQHIWSTERVASKQFSIHMLHPQWPSGCANTSWFCYATHAALSIKPLLFVLAVPPAFHVAWNNMGHPHSMWHERCGPKTFFTIKLIDCHWIVWTSFHSMHNLWVESIYLSQRGQYIDAPWRANILTRRINILPRPQGLMTQMGGTHRSNWQDFVNVCQYIRHIGNNDSASATKHGRNIQEDGISDKRPVSWLSICHQILLTCQSSMQLCDQWDEFEE